MTESAAPYPVHLDIEYPGRLSRWLIFVKWVLAIPHFIVLPFLWLAAGLATLAAFVLILFTRRYPANLFAFVVAVQQWTNRVLAYVLLLRDEYPPFAIRAAAQAGGPLLIIVTALVGSFVLLSAGVLAGILGLALAVDEIRPDLIACEPLQPGQESRIQTGWGTYELNQRDPKARATPYLVRLGGIVVGTGPDDFRIEDDEGHRWSPAVMFGTGGDSAGYALIFEINSRFRPVKLHFDQGYFFIHQTYSLAECT